MPTTVIHVRLPDDVLANLAGRAAADRRTIGAYVRLLLEDHAADMAARDTVTLTDAGREANDALRAAREAHQAAQPLLRADGSPPQSGDVLVSRGGRQVYEARPEPKPAPPSRERQRHTEGAKAARAARRARPDPK